MTDSAHSYLPSIKCVRLRGGAELPFSPGSVTFVVGPNNGGKSSFLRELTADYSPREVNRSKWIEKVEWELGTKEEFDSYLKEFFEEDGPTWSTELRTGKRVLRAFTDEFYKTYRLGHPDHLVRSLDAQSRIGLSNRVPSPDVVERRITHPYHAFFFDPQVEADFSSKVFSAFGHHVRLNRTGSQTVAHLGQVPDLQRLSSEYEQYILQEMVPIDKFGDGVRSYLGLLLNFSADARPVTIIDEPEAFLHPPQAFRLGREIATLARTHRRQAIIATHSSDLIKGALSADLSDIQFLYLDHTKTQQHHVVEADVVEAFGREPFLVHTDALDGLFYSDVVVCEADADIMFFKWALSSSESTIDLDNVFWIPSYGKSAVPGILRSMAALGISPKCVFDIDVLLSLNILEDVCHILGFDIKPYKTMLKSLPDHIKVPPVAATLSQISDILSDVPETDGDDASRNEAIRKIKRAAESLSKSWSLKATGLRLFPKGDLQRNLREMLDSLAEQGILILREGEIENYVPSVGGHGRTWVRHAIEAGSFEPELKTSLLKQFEQLLDN